MSRVGFAVEEYYHCFNRGTEKRDVFLDKEDFSYFLDALDLFNQIKTLGSMRNYRYPSHTRAARENERDRLVEIVAYCLNRNHYHLLLHEIIDGGISKFMQKLITGYTHYFNKKYHRSGVLFQGKFKYVRMENDTQLRHVGVYVNLNNLAHKITSPEKYRASIDGYNKNDYHPKCKHHVLTEGYGDIEAYRREALKRLPLILSRKEDLKGL